MVRSLLASGNWTPFFKPLAKAAKSNDVAIFFSELCNRQELYESRGELTDDGFFFATVESLEGEINMSKHKQSKAIVYLVTRELIEVDLRGMPARRHFRISEGVSNKLAKILTTGSSCQKIDQQEVKKFDNKLAKNSTSYRELNYRELNNTTHKGKNEFEKKSDTGLEKIFSKVGIANQQEFEALPRAEKDYIAALAGCYQFLEDFSGQRGRLLDQARISPEDRNFDFDEQLKEAVRRYLRDYPRISNIQRFMTTYFQSWLVKYHKFKPKTVNHEKTTRSKRQKDGINYTAEDATRDYLHLVEHYKRKGKI